MIQIHRFGGNTSVHRRGSSAGDPALRQHRYRRRAVEQIVVGQAVDNRKIEVKAQLRHSSSTSMWQSEKLDESSNGRRL